MSLKNWQIARRTFLRGTGAALALPFLDAMGPLSRLSSPAALAADTPQKNLQAPVRMACMYFPNGVWEKTWIPEKEGGDFPLPFALEPLGDLRRKTLVLSGLDKAHSRDGDGHYAKTANFLTGLHVQKTTGKELSVGSASIDQLCAQKIGHLTPLPSLELGIDPVISGIDSNVGYTRLYGSYISWRSASTPVAREINPRTAYERLFGIGSPTSLTPEQKRKHEDDRALLDLVLEDAGHLRGRLGRDDQFKLDEYLDSVRAVEKRIAFFSQPDPRGWKPPTQPGQDMAAPAGEPGDHQEHVRLMMDMIFLAFWTDTTRLSTFMFANDVSGKNFGRLIPGTEGSHHEFSHHQGKAEKFEPYSKINRWHVDQLVYLMKKMDSVQEGGRTLLDNSMVFFGSSMSDGNRHDPNNLPVLLAGGGGGTIQGGRHIASPKNTPLCNLYVSMLERMGTPVEKFGDSSGPLAIG